MIDSRVGSKHRCILVPSQHTPPLPVARLHDWPTGRNKRFLSLPCRRVWALPPRKIPAAAISIQVTKITPLVRPYRIFMSSPTARPTRIPRPQSRIIPDRFSCARVYLIVWTPVPACIYQAAKSSSAFCPSYHSNTPPPRWYSVRSSQPATTRCEIRATSGKEPTRISVCTG